MASGVLAVSLTAGGDMTTATTGMALQAESFGTLADSVSGLLAIVAEGGGTLPVDENGESQSIVV